MERVKYIILICLLLSATISYSQSSKKQNADISVSFKVYGVCGQCKERIEEAVKGKGVKNAAWDENSQMLSLLYNPAKVSLDQLKDKIVAVGHDVEDRKANVTVYEALPKCCLYRETGALTNHNNNEINTAVDSFLLNSTNLESPLLKDYIKGIVLNEDSKGSLTALRNASIFWLGTDDGVITDSSGIFNIRHNGKSSRLVVSFSGYKSDTISVSSLNDLKIVLASKKQLKEVVVSTRKRSVYTNNFSTVRTQTMTGAELLKAACCNLSESFETNPSVDVSYNDAVTGSKQIQLLGLSGIYTQLTVENLPGPRGLATPLGLNSIAGPWIESIQLTKGVGSVANGYESIAGQINVELKKPENSEKLWANLYVNGLGKTDLNLNLSQKINSKWSAGLLLHDDFLKNKKIDFNKDGFRDQPTGNTFSMVNRYKFDNSKGVLAQFGIKIFNDRRTGGEVNFDPGKDKNTTNLYGLGINTDRYEAFAKIGYLFPEKKYKSIGLQIAAISHEQDSYFGLTTYTGKQKTFYSNLIYQSIIKTTIHKFRAGLSFLYDNYDEDFKLTKYKRTEIVPGVFGEYTYTPNDKFSVVAGLRADHNSLFGFFVTPRLNLRYEPVKGTIIRGSVGRGQRTANIFAENTSVFVSARQVNIIASGSGKAYGLNPEVAWNKGISIDQKFKLFNNDALIVVDFFRNDFSNQVVVDLENARGVSFYNLNGKSFSNSLQAELNIEPVKKLDIRLAYRYFDVKTTLGNKLMERQLISKNRAFVNLAYELRGFKFDYTVTYNGKKRIPDTQANIPAYQFANYSPDYVLMNAQISKTFGKKHEIDVYIGAENLTNYFQKDAIVAAAQPFSQYFDASMVWGPLSGRMFYSGIRFKIK